MLPTPTKTIKNIGFVIPEGRASTYLGTYTFAIPKGAKKQSFVKNTSTYIYGTNDKRRKT